MRNVKVKKEEVLEIIRRNHKQHRAIFLEAVDGYRKQAVELLEKHIQQIKDGRVVIVNVSLPTPMDYTRDYERAIRMLEMSVDDVIELDEESFGQYVMDQWEWKHRFLSSNSAYSGTAASFLDNKI